MAISNSNSDSYSAPTFEDIVALLEDVGWHDEAEAAIGSGARAQIRVDCTMTRAQADVIRSIGTARGQGVLPCWIPLAECVVWAHSVTIGAGEGVLPECYWNRGSTGAYEYISCTSNTMAAVLPDGSVRGRTRTVASRLAGDGRADLPAPQDGWEARLDALVGRYWEALAAFHRLPDGRGSQEGMALLREADGVLAEAQALAAAAMGRGAPEWQVLPHDWLGESPTSGCPHSPR